jgi:hypothetical protein
VTTGGDDATVSHVLTARDRAACGVLVRRFSVQWWLRRTAEAWRTIALTAQQLGAPAACG